MSTKRTGSNRIRRASETGTVPLHGALVIAAVLGWTSLQPAHAAECSANEAGKIAVERYGGKALSVSPGRGLPHRSASVVGRTSHRRRRRPMELLSDWMALARKAADRTGARRRVGAEQAARVARGERHTRQGTHHPGSRHARLGRRQSLSMSKRGCSRKAGGSTPGLSWTSISRALHDARDSA